MRQVMMMMMILVVVMITTMTVVTLVVMVFGEGEETLARGDDSALGISCPSSYLEL